MTSRERVLAALRHEETDRAPRLLYGEVIGYVPAIERLLKEHCGDMSPREFFDMDLTGAEPNPSKLGTTRFEEWLPEAARTASERGHAFNWAAGSTDGPPVDEWGVWWRGGGYEHFCHIESPLAEVHDLNRIKEFPWPDLEEPYRWEGLAGRVAALHDDGVAVAAYAGAVYEQAWFLRGMVNLLTDMMTQPEVAHYLFDRTAHFQKVCAVEMARADIDIIMLGDDVAQQQGLLMSIDTWREFLKPRLKATIDAVRAVRPDARIFYHSDGRVDDLIPELIEVGIDILNPVQPDCMDPAAVKARYGDRLSFWGTISVQHTMPFGTPDAVKAEVRERIRTVGRGGGLILAPAHVLEPEVPWQNIAALFEAADEAE